MPAADRPPSAFRRLAPAARLVEVVVGGEPLRLPEGEPLAAALLAQGVLATGGSVRLGEGRGPFCMMGSCFQCAAVVDGVHHQRTCRLPVRAGMRIEFTPAGGGPQ